MTDFPARIEADLAFHLQLCRQAGNSMLVEAWQHLEGRMRVAILNGAAWQAPMMARDRHAPIVDAIERADVAAALRGRRRAHGLRRRALRPVARIGLISRRRHRHRPPRRLAVQGTATAFARVPRRIRR